MPAARQTLLLLSSLCSHPSTYVPQMSAVYSLPLSYSLSGALAITTVALVVRRGVKRKLDRDEEDLDKTVKRCRARHQSIEVRFFPFLSISNDHQVLNDFQVGGASVESAELFSISGSKSQVRLLLPFCDAGLLNCDRQIGGTSGTGAHPQPLAVTKVRRLLAPNPTSFESLTCMFQSAHPYRSFPDVPDDVLAEIYSRIKYKENELRGIPRETLIQTDILAISQVSRRLTAHALRRYLDMRGLSIVDNASSVSARPYTFVRVSTHTGFVDLWRWRSAPFFGRVLRASLSFSRTDDLLVEEVALLRDFLHNLPGGLAHNFVQGITLNWTSDSTALLADVIEMLKQFKLTTLDVHCGSGRPGEAVEIAFGDALDLSTIKCLPTITSFSVTGSHMFSAALAPITLAILHRSRLRFLSIWDSGVSTAQWREMLPLISLSSLVSLTVRDSIDGDTMLDFLCRHPRLIFLSYESSADPTSLRRLPVLPWELSLRSLYSLTASAEFIDIAFASSTSQFIELEHLGILPHNVEDIAGDVAVLERLDVATVQGVFRHAAYCEKLSRLSLTFPIDNRGEHPFFAEAQVHNAYAEQQLVRILQLTLGSCSLEHGADLLVRRVPWSFRCVAYFLFRS